MLAETKRRHEALIDDREDTERKHQSELDEMMTELKRRQAIIAKLEGEVATAREASCESNKRLSVMEVQVRATRWHSQLSSSAWPRCCLY